MATYLSTRFTLRRLTVPSVTLTVTEMTTQDVRDTPDIIPVVYQKVFADVFESVLGTGNLWSTQRFFLKPGDTLIVGHYNGDYLKEGTIYLPPYATITWIKIKVSELQK